LAAKVPTLDHSIFYWLISLVRNLPDRALVQDRPKGETPSKPRYRWKRSSASIHTK